jgi:putative ABC transport system substrate-binding protein
MRRREFVAGLGGAAAAWSLPVRAQQPAMPVVGFLNGGAPAGYAVYVAGFLQGLNESGYVEGKNVTVDYQWARGHYDQLQVLAADLIRRKVAVIAANTPATPVAKAATTEIPIVFVSTGDPVTAGLVKSFNQPGGNVTGVGLLGAELESKRLGLLHQLVSGTAPIGVLVNPKNPAANLQLRELQEAAGVIQRQIEIVRASTALENETAFAHAVHKGAVALLVVQDPFYNSQREQLVALGPNISCRSCIHCASSPKSAASSVTDMTSWTGIAKWVFTPGAFSRVRSLPIFPWCSPKSSSSSSMPRPPRRSG